MVEIRSVTRVFAVASQIFPEETPLLADRFALLVNNRPDDEAPEQPSSGAVEIAAREAGLAYAWIPVAGAPTPEQVEAMRVALASAQGEVLAFCRSGTRSILTWALAEALAGRPAEAVEQEAARAGYQIGPPLRALLPRLRAGFSG